MRLLLTGPTGFIGSAFLELALSRGHQVAALVCPGESLPTGLAQDPGVTRISGTLAEAPWKAIDAFHPEACVHTAWIATPGVYLESPLNQKFVDWSLSFLDRVADAGCGRVVALGSCAEYRMGPQPLSEDATPAEPGSAYARCKNALRLALEERARRKGGTVCWGRVFYPYGIGEHPARLCSSLIAQLAQNQSVVLKTPDSVKDYIYIDDLASALMTVVELGVAGVVNLGTGRGTSVREIAQAIGSLLGCPHLVSEQHPTVFDPLGRVVADTSRLRSLGWRPQVGLRAGLERLIDRLKP